MRDVQALLRDYLTMRRALGFKMQKYEETLKEFVSFFKKSNAKYLTTDFALKWAQKPTEVNPAWWTERLSMLRGFAAYWKIYDSRAEVPPHKILTTIYKRPSPHIYSNDEVCKILNTASQFFPERLLFKHTYSTLFAMLWATGLRVGEARALNREDVDLSIGVIKIRETKFTKSRLIPIHATTRKALQKYATMRDKVFIKLSTPAFFVSDHTSNGTRLGKHTTQATFRKVLHKGGIRHISSKKGPRIHDMRHTFTVNTLIKIYKNGTDINRKIYALSVYLGHQSISSTYWYFSAVPELMRLAMKRVERMDKNEN